MLEYGLQPDAMTRSSPGDILLQAANADAHLTHMHTHRLRARPVLGGPHAAPKRLQPKHGKLGGPLGSRCPPSSPKRPRNSSQDCRGRRTQVTVGLLPGQRNPGFLATRRPKATPSGESARQRPGGGAKSRRNPPLPSAPRAAQANASNIPASVRPAREPYRSANGRHHASSLQTGERILVVRAYPPRRGKRSPVRKELQISHLQEDKGKKSSRGDGRGVIGLICASGRSSRGGAHLLHIGGRPSRAG